MKVLLTATVQSHICQFHKPLVEMLHEHGVEVHVAARDNLAEKNGLKLDFVKKVYNVPFSRSPKSTDNLKAYKQLKKIIDEGGYDIIHCNTPMGGIVTRLAARNVRKNGTKVFYTAHGFHFYNGAPKKNWLVYYPIEKFFAGHYTDKLITITEEDYKLASEKFKCQIEHIHGVGVKSDRYRPASIEEQHEMRVKEGLNDDDFVILCTGELLPNKNQKTLIDAVNLCKDKIPNIKLLLAGNGPEKENLQQKIEDLRLQDKVRLLGYRTDLERVAPCVDVIASASIREGLPLNIIEGMLCAKTVIASHNRGHNELVEEGVTGYLVDAKSAEGFAEKFKQAFFNNDQNMGNIGFAKVEDYTSVKVKKELDSIYAE